jgi:hypothetical protein
MSLQRNFHPREDLNNPQTILASRLNFKSNLHKKKQDIYYQLSRSVPFIDSSSFVYLKKSNL